MGVKRGETRRVAAAQAASVWLNPAATSDKAIALLEEASRQGIDLVAFPESFLSGYPFWVMLDGGSCIVAPGGSWVVEPTVGAQGLIVAEIDPARIASARYSFDPTGHYARPDVFEMTVDRRQDAVAFT